MKMFLTAALLSATLGVDASTADPDSRLTAMVRADLETEFRQQFGLGFQSFRCDFGNTDSLPPEFECEAVDDDGDRFVYRAWQGNDELPGGITVWQPITQLYPEGVSWLRGPIDEFLSALEDNDPKRFTMTLSPELASSIQGSETWNELMSLLDAIGPIQQAEPTLYSNPGTDVHAVEYRITGDQGELAGRFRIEGAGEEPGQLSAFLVVPATGSALHVRQLEGVAGSILSPYLGETVVDVRMPLNLLLRTGDVAEGEVALADGRTIAIRAEQSATTTDFASNDYRFQILEASWLVSRHLSASGDDSATVTCPARTVPDGGSMACTIERPEGSTERIELRRRGGDHRLFPAEG